MLKVGLILYSVRDEMAKDPIATVEKVGKLGYKYIETCNHNAELDSGSGFGIDAKILKETLDKFGSKVISAHVNPIDKADIRAVIEYNKVLGNKDIVNPMGRFASYDDLMKQCEAFNATGKICREEGMNYYYHNHDHEFRTINGKSVMDYIVENTDPNYLSLELDTFWTMRAGVCPIEQIKHFGKRIKLIHQKDFAWDSIAPINTIGITPEEREIEKDGSILFNFSSKSPTPEQKEYLRKRSSAFAEIGTGIMPIQKIIDATIKYTDSEFIILEQDATRMESQIASIEKSMEAFKKFNGISWD